MKNWKIIIGLVLAYYLFLAIIGWVGIRNFDLNKFNGTWTGTRQLKIGKFDHTQFHKIRVNNSTFKHFVQNPLNGDFNNITDGVIEKGMLSICITNFQKNVDYEIVNIEYNEDNSIYSFCVIKKGDDPESCDIRFHKSKIE